MPAKLLKLRAADTEDIQIISAMLQDSIVPVCDMALQTETNTFILVAQRLRREIGEAATSERICAALTIKGVTAAHTQGFDPLKLEQMLDLLAIMLEPPTTQTAQQLILIFAGNARLRLDLGDWTATVEDFGHPWPALCHPCHDTEAKPQ